MIKQGKFYTKEKLNNLPKDVLKKAKVSFIKASGILVQDKLVRKIKKEDKKLSKSQAVLLTIEDVIDMASETIVDNDKTYLLLSPDVVLQRQYLDTLSQMTFWNNLTVRDGFWWILKEVLPMVWSNKFGTESKKKILAIIKLYLHEVNHIAEGKMNNSIRNDNVDGLEKIW